jgi:integral membrane sensor domain MASE1
MEKTVWQTMASLPNMARPTRKKALSEGEKFLLMGAIGGLFLGGIVGLGFFI